MSTKRRDERRLRHRGEHPEWWSSALRAVALAGSAALLVVTVLVPSEAAIPNGTGAPLAAGWCLLLVLFAASLFLDGEPALRIGWTEVAGAAFVGWHSLAAVLSLGETNGRLALNAHWLVVSYGIAAFLLRQLVRTLDQARCLVAAMIWLATLVAALGLYQYFYSMPRQRLEYERSNPAETLAAADVPAAANSPLRELFENRVQSVEPIGTFALTNSLAGFLAPWLLAALALGMANFDGTRNRQFLVSLTIALLLMAACLVLTKSRSAYLATGAGIGLLALYGRSAAATKWRLNWRVPAVAAGIALLLGLAAVVLGGLDVEVLSEAPKSVLYRLEYWQATARMILDYPLFGSGPGNFQEMYAAYKLPQASETVADPHNFLLEIWATAGTPALLLFLGLVLGFVRDLTRPQARERQKLDEPLASSAFVILGGAALGLLVGPWISAAMGFPLGAVHDSFPLPVVWLLGAMAAGGWWQSRSWLASGRLPMPALLVPLVVLLINLLAAGAFSFPGVWLTMLVLVPAALCVAQQPRAGEAQTYAARQADTSALPAVVRLSHAAASGIFAATAVIAAICLYTEYYPVLRGQSALAEALYALDQRLFNQAEPKAAEAARADSLSPEPWRLISELRLARWQARGQDKDWDDFRKAADTFQALNPRHHLAWFERGKWFLTAWKKSGERGHLDEALRAFQQAIKHYPNKALYHAQLAWTLHLAGDEENAGLAADTAWKLDQRMPHKEQKLAHQHVVDPQVPPASGPLEREETAEQTVERLRTAPAEKLP